MCTIQTGVVLVCFSNRDYVGGGSPVMTDRRVPSTTLEPGPLMETGAEQTMFSEGVL